MTPDEQRRAAGASHKLQIRHPANLRLERTLAPSETEAARLSSGAVYLERIWLACLIAVVMGALPMVMFLRR